MAVALVVVLVVIVVVVFGQLPHRGQCPIAPLHTRKALLSYTSFWAADPKGTKSYRTEGVISVRPSDRTSERTNV